MALESSTGLLRVAFFLLVALSQASCDSMYFSAMEKVGIHKRDILKDRIEDAQHAQEETKEQFVSALDEFKAVLRLEETSLEKRYKSLQSEYDASQAAAQEVRDKIAAVESVSDALFKEWEAELTLFGCAKLRRISQTKLIETKRQYGKLMVLMKQAEAKMSPVLDTLRDQTLFLKHNLNAQAITAVRAELNSIERDVDSLVLAMEKSIKEAEVFIKKLK
jgi:hypothetical protein